MLKNKKWMLLGLFLLAVAAGISYPVMKIIRYDFPSSPPAVYRFKAGIVDPYDPFRGRYVTLSPLPTEVTLPEKKEFDYDDVVYAVLAHDADGFAQVVNLVANPNPGEDAVRVSYYRPYWGEDEQSGGPKAYVYRINLPFTRFYMNERLAPEAERAVTQAISTEGATCAIVVNIYRDGNYSIKDLEINGIPIHQYLRERQREEE